MYYRLAAAIAIEAAIRSNFLGNHFITFRKSAHKTSVLKKFLLFQLISMVTLVLSLGILWLLTTTFGIRYLIILNFVTIFTVFVANFILNRRFTWTHAEVHMDVAETG
jgi:putative flippase GtrA